MGAMRFSRRGALAAAAAAYGAVSTRALHAQGATRTFVLVHGAWHGGWCWRRVADLLEKGGHKVFLPTLTGLGERSHLVSKDVNVSTHVADVANVIKWEDLSDIVLVGHSYGGLAISGVADQLSNRISSIIFLDAFFPEDGDTLLDKSSPAFKSAIEAALGRGDISVKQPPASAFGVAQQDREWVDSKTTPQPIGTYTEKSSFKGGRDKIAKRNYIRAKGYASPTFDANLAKIRGQPGWQVAEIDTGHDVMIIDPSKLTSMLIEMSWPVDAGLFRRSIKTSMPRKREGDRGRLPSLISLSRRSPGKSRTRRRMAVRCRQIRRMKAGIRPGTKCRPICCRRSPAASSFRDSCWTGPRRSSA